MNNTLELTWNGKNNKITLDKHHLIENTKLSYGKKITNNMIIQGDNLLALKTLEEEYKGKIKCIYIDPPYNTGKVFDHYSDELEHNQWLNFMKPRIEQLKKLLKNDGSLWISIDADESHYLKVLCDEIFGRNNFVDEIVWQRAYSPINLKKTISRSHDSILVYAKNKIGFTLNKLPRTKEANKRYKNLDNDPRGNWKSSDLSVGPIVASKVYEIITPSGRRVTPPSGYCWRLTQKRFEEYLSDNRIWFGVKGDAVPSIKRFLSEVKQGITPMSLWTYQEVGHNQDAKKEVKIFNSSEVFTTPKPEKLIERILTLASDKGDIVLDAFLGSATTIAVAHKMHRKYIGIELGDHTLTHCIPRMKMVIEGEQGGISKNIEWKGGGGFKFYTLHKSI